MISAAESIFIAVAIVAGSLIFLFVLDRLWPTEARRQHNDIVGWQASVVGTTYAVIVGFMLYAVWTDFGAATQNVDAEANALVNVSRLANGLPQEERVAVQAIAQRYADSMVTEEWAAMSRGSLTLASRELTQQLWVAVIRPQNLDALQQTTLDHLITQLNALTEHRRIRELEVQTGLPGILWSVLIVGAIITIASSCLFGTKSFPLHLLQVFGLSILLALSLVAVAEIDRPYQGGVRVRPDAFIRAQQTLRLTSQ